MYREITKWLRIQSMPVAESHLRLRLESHPDYPSLIAVQDTLEELSINSYVCRGAKEELKNENRPFLAHFNMDEGQIIFFKNVQEAEKRIKDFDKYWSGHVMFLDKSVEYGNTEHDKLYQKEKLNRAFGISAIVLFTVILLCLSIASHSLPIALLTVSDFTGLYFSWLIVQKEFGISNSISDKICSMAKHSRCESVLFSKGARLFNWLSWGDVGMVYFTGSLLYLLLSLLTDQPRLNGSAGQAINLYYFISITGLIFPVYSLYYQWKVVKQWCMLCLGVLAALAINGIMGLLQITGTAKPLSAELAERGRWVSAETLLYSITFFFSFTVWQLFKSLYQKSLASLPDKIKAERLKRNPEIFNALLQKQEINPANLPETDEAIQFGSPSASYQILIACNPYCGTCAKAHHAIEQVYEKHPGKLSVSIRFALSSSDDKDSKVIAAKEILKAAKLKPFEAMRDWYSFLNLDKYKMIHVTNGADINSSISKHIIWSKKAAIKATLTVFINGRQLPELYNWKDFSEMLEFELK